MISDGKKFQFTAICDSTNISTKDKIFCQVTIIHPAGYSRVSNGFDFSQRPPTKACP